MHQIFFLQRYHDDYSLSNFFMKHVSAVADVTFTNCFLEATQNNTNSISKTPSFYLGFNASNWAEHVQATQTPTSTLPSWSQQHGSYQGVVTMDSAISQHIDLNALSPHLPQFDALNPK
jgi:hypothetical protein